MPTEREEERLLETALSVADDAAIDWEQARRDLPQEAGARPATTSFSLSRDGRSDSGALAAPGVYFLRLEAAGGASPGLGAVRVTFPRL